LFVFVHNEKIEKQNKKNSTVLGTKREKKKEER